MSVDIKEKSKTDFNSLFNEPANEFRGAPFWAWNTKITKDILEKQLPVFREMGFGGYHVHPRTGLDTEYLSDEFMDMVRLCAEYARKNGMKCYGYDEDRFPSGSAGGMVTKNIEYRQRKLVWTKHYDSTILTKRPDNRATEDYYLGKYEIYLDDEGYIVKYKRIKLGEGIDEGENIRYALVKIAEPETWFNNQTYVDTMYKPAMDEFIRTSHKRYYDELGEYFGDIIPSFFTDEPKVAYKKVLSEPWDETDIVLPWTDDLADSLFEKYGIDIVEFIPELYFELPDDRVSKARYFYHRHVLERFCDGFSKNIGKWCDEHGVSLAGHMVKEPKLSSQSVSAGEVMAPLSSFAYPGIDMLCDAREYTTAKQTQSIKDQFGREKMLSELYGVTNWLFDFRGHKLGGDWQAALGVNLRVPHLAWMSMKGEAKRDYPASIFYQSPWYKEYTIIEDHFARVNFAMSQGKRVCKIAMIHPVESCWLKWGVKSQTKEELKRMDNSFKSITEKLLFSQLDFDYISEAILPEQFNGIDDGRFLVGDMKYQVIIVPECLSMRSTTKKLLDEWIAEGGQVYVLRNYPSVMDGEQINPESQFDKYNLLEDEEKLIELLSEYRDFTICDKDEKLSNQFLVQERSDGNDLWFFIANGRKDENESCLYEIDVNIKHKGYPYLYDSLSGGIFKLMDIGNADSSRFTLKMHKHDSALICIKSNALEETDGVYLTNDEYYDEEIAVSDRVPVSLSEENCLILDIGRYYLDGKVDEISKPDEILRIGQSAREQLGISLDGAKMAQPWTKEKKKAEHTITVRYSFRSKVDIFNAHLALEDADISDIYFNGKLLLKEKDGYYVDEAIERLILPPIHKGENTIEITIGIGEGTDLEAAYLLGDFSVYKDDLGYYLDEPVRELDFSDVTKQGLPFYGGNINYCIYYDAGEGELLIGADSYKGSLISVNYDSERIGNIIFDPYRCYLSNVEEGRHAIELCLYGNRVNTFGPLHNRLKPLKWVGPEAFRTRDFFTYDYELSEFGILKKPIIKIKRKK